MKQLISLSLMPASMITAHTIVLRDGGGGFRFIEAESIVINGKAKLRVASGIAAGATAAPKQLERFAPAAIESTGLIRTSGDGAWMARSGGGQPWYALTPESTVSKSPQPLGAMWNTSTIAYRRDKSQKTLETIPNSSIAFIVANRSIAESAALLGTERWPHQTDDEKSGADGLRAMLPSAAQAAANTPSLQIIRGSLRARLRGPSEAWARGNTTIGVLQSGLAYADTADRAFPNDSEIAALTKTLRGQKSRLDRDAAVLEALDAGGQSAAFLRKYREFERYDRSFEKLPAARKRHYINHAEILKDRGLARYQKTDFTGALRDLRLSARINPEEVSISKALDEVRLESARRSAAAIAAKRKGIDARAPREVQLRRHLLMADQLFRDSKLDDAMKAIEAAAAIDATNPGVALAQARMLEAKGELGAALRAIDAYNAMIAGESEAMEAEKIRAGIAYKIQQQKKSILSTLEGAFREHKFAHALDLASKGLQLDPEEPAFLYHAGASACVLRKCAAGAPLLNRFIEFSDSLQGDRKPRMTAMAMLASAAPAPAKSSAAKTARSWFSGEPVPEKAYYDPASLMFLPKVIEIKASKKLTVSYEWAGERLATVRSKYEDNKVFANIFSAAMAGVAASQGMTTSMTTYGANRDTTDFFFSYYSDAPQIQQVSSKQVSVRGGKSESLLTPPVYSNGLLISQGNVDTYSKQADETQDSSKGFITLPSSPRIDPPLAYLATGRRVTTVFSGNSYFHPFAWHGIHLFEASYDDDGRILYAWEKGADNGRLDFTWEGQRLLKVEMRPPKGDGPALYSRTLQYNGERLIGESIQHGGRQSKIVYKYDKTGKLLEAECEEDHSLDGRSRRVIFGGE